MCFQTTTRPKVGAACAFGGVESSRHHPLSRALSRNVRLPHHNVVALRTLRRERRDEPTPARRENRLLSRVYSEAARFLETASVPAGERGERGGQRGRTTDGTGTNDRRAKRATRRPTRPTSLPRRRTQARLERSGKPRPLGTVAREYAPSRNPFLKRRGRVLRYLMRPVPVVRRPMAFVDQLSVSAAEGGRVSRRDFSRTRQIRGFAWPEGGVGIATRTVPLAGRGVAARAARGLLDVEGATTTPAMSRGRRARSRQSIASKTLTKARAFLGG